MFNAYDARVEELKKETDCVWGQDWIARWQ